MVFMGIHFFCYWWCCCYWSCFFWNEENTFFPNWKVCTFHMVSMFDMVSLTGNDKRVDENEKKPEVRERERKCTKLKMSIFQITTDRWKSTNLLDAIGFRSKLITFFLHVPVFIGHAARYQYKDISAKYFEAEKKTTDDKMNTPTKKRWFQWNRS